MVTEIIGVITSAITSFLSAIGSSIVGLFQDITMTSEGELTAMATWLLVFLGLSVAIGLGRLVFAIFRTRS